MLKMYGVVIQLWFLVESVVGCLECDACLAFGQGTYPVHALFVLTFSKEGFRHLLEALSVHWIVLAPGRQSCIAERSTIVCLQG